VDTIITLLTDFEAMESSSSVSPLSSSIDALDLRTITPGVQQGEDYLLYRASCDRMEELLRQCRSCQSYTHPNVCFYYEKAERKQLLRARVSQLEEFFSNESLALFPDFMKRKAVLQALGYVDDTTEAVCLKGRIACEVNSCESLIATELILDGILNELEPAEIVAVLSALVAKEKTSDEEETQLSELPRNLIRCCNRIKSIAYDFGALQKNHGLLVDPVDYVDEVLKFGLVQVVYEWALGVPFCNICELTMIQEGSIVRCITRLDELCREVRNCARVAGNPTLYQKMEAASAAIKRDIVFASSLYVY
jgi:antiviral helicase SKI2